MARPKKHADELRSDWARCRVTVAEREVVRANAANVGLDETEFIRRRILGAALPPARSGSDPAYIAALNNYAVALSQIGNNVNQLAAATHQGRDFAQYWPEIGAELQAELQAARDALKLSLKDSAG